MTTPHVKRRRLNDSVSLQKPFRSPLKVTSPATIEHRSTHSPSALAPPVSSSVHNASSKTERDRGSAEDEDRSKFTGPLLGDTTGRPSGTAYGKPGCAHLSESTQDPSKSEIPDSESEPSPLVVDFPGTPGQLETPAATCETPQDVPAVIDVGADETFVRAQHAVVTEPVSRKVLNQERDKIRLLTSQIDLLESCPLITRRNSANELRTLIRTWKRVAQDAADLLFPSIRDRVEGSGGMKQLVSPTNGNTRDRRGELDRLDEAEDCLRKQEEELQRGVFGDGERLGDTERRLGLEDVRAMKLQLDDQRRALEKGNEFDDDHYCENDDHELTTFTMGMMLRGMNIEHDLIGWDDREGQWKQEE